MFTVVTAVLFGVGLVGGAILLSRVKEQLYAQQVASQRRNAEAMARILARDLAAGQSETAVIAQLQAATEGMGRESEFLCLLDRDGRLLSHPDPRMVGMSKSSLAVTGFGRETARTTYTDILHRALPAAGLLTGPEGNAVQLVYFQPVPGSSWTITAHENARAVAGYLRSLGWKIVAVLAPTVALMALAGTFAARVLGRRYERSIEAANDELEHRVAERTVELRRAFIELEESHRRLMQSDKMHLLGELMAGIAHEINNPLTIITGYADFLASGGCGEMAAATGARLQTGTERVRRIVGNLLAFARNDPPARRLTSVGGLLESAHELIGADLRRAGIAFTLDYPPDLPALCLDAQQFEQVFLNLLNNARQALEKHPGERTIRVTVREQTGVVLVDFADTGPGLAAPVRARLFEPFHTTKADGNGLGLSLCRRFVEAHGARIEAPAVASGTVFRLHLPRATMSEACALPETARA